MRKTMNNLFYCVITILITCIVPSCTSDYSQNLGQKYVYRDEGGRIKEIFSQESDGEQIPATVISFDYNRQFIIAKQKPKIPQDPIITVLISDMNTPSGSAISFTWVYEPTFP